jgi:hypothetical protein
MYTALAEYSPTQEAAQLVDDYVSSKDVRWDHGFDNDSFELAIIKRNDRYLDIKIARGIRKIDHAHILWERATSSLSSGDLNYAKAVREALIVGKCGIQLITGDSFGFSSKLTEIGKSVFPDFDSSPTDLARAFFQSNNSKNVLSKFSINKAPFEKISNVYSLIAWNSIVNNPCINYDNSNEHGPDLVAWDMQKGIKNLLLTAPVNWHWLCILHSLVVNLNPSSHYFTKENFDIELFLKKWVQLDDTNPERDENLESEEGTYTTLTFRVEMVAILIAKFHIKFESCVEFKNEEDAKVSQDELSKAYYFGKLSPRAFLKEFKEGLLGRNATFFGLLNNNLYKDDNVTEKLLEYFEDDTSIDHFFNHQLSKSQAVKTSDRKHLYAVQDDMDTVISMLGKIRSDHESLKNWFELFKDDLKTAKYWLWLILGVLVIKSFL